MWTEIVDQSDIDKLMHIYGNFHDSCIRDIYLSTQEFVDEKGAMHFENVLTASLLFQRQTKENKTLELKFEFVDQLNYNPLKNSYSNVLYDAYFKFHEGLFYWSDDQDWKIEDNDAIWISGKKVFWRLRPELAGNVQRLKE
jgi:hypothetical protein